MAYHHLRQLLSSQYCCEMIELADSWAWSANSVLSCTESVREVHSVLPFNFTVKSGCWIYFINVGIHLLKRSGKLCRVPDFGDFCSWKRNFGIGMYGDGSGVELPFLLLTWLWVGCRFALLCVHNLKRINFFFQGWAEQNEWCCGKQGVSCIFIATCLWNDDNVLGKKMVCMCVCLSECVCLCLFLLFFIVFYLTQFMSHTLT